MSTTSAKRRIGCQASEITCRGNSTQRTKLTETPKGDDRKPTCAHCARKKIHCVRGINVRFRHSFNPTVDESEIEFACDQPWCRTSQTNFHFVDETKEITNIYEGDSDSDHNQISTTDGRQWSPGSRLIVPSSYQAVGDVSIPEHRELGASLGKRRRIDSLSDLSSTVDGIALHDSGLWQQSHGEGLNLPGDQASRRNHFWQPVTREPAQPSVPATATATANCVSHTSSQAVCFDVPSLPLRDRQEAELMVHFVQHLAASFDLCDSNHHFKLVTPERAALCPALLNAIFAASAKHLGRIAGLDSILAVQYHQKALQYLIPTLDNITTAVDENLLAAAVILGFLHEIQETNSEIDNQSRMLGIQALRSVGEVTVAPGSLYHAAFLAGLRQEIHMAITHQRPITLDLNHCNIDRGLGPADDCTWANRVVLHSVEIINYCFGNDQEHVASHNQLYEYLDQWMSLKPASFNPVFFLAAAQNHLFPEIWLLSDAVVTGLQHYYLGRMLLTAHTPKIPRLGPARRATLGKMDKEIKRDVCMLVGIAESINRMHPSYVTACMAIALAGDRFTGRSEQCTLFGILQKTEKSYGWSTSVAQGHLKEAWGWE